MPLLIRSMLVLEDSDEDRLYFGRGVPRSWVGSGKEISIQEAPTRWGAVSFSLTAKPEKKSLGVVVELAKPNVPKELHITLRVPEQTRLQAVTVNGRAVEANGPRKETVIVKSGAERVFEINALYA